MELVRFIQVFFVQLLLGVLPTVVPRGAAALRLDEKDAGNAVHVNGHRIAPSASVEAAVSGPMFGCSWLSAVHQVVNSCIRQQLHWAAATLGGGNMPSLSPPPARPPAAANASTPPTSLIDSAANATTDRNRRVSPGAFADAFNDEKYVATKIAAAGAKALGNDVEQEDLEIVNDIQAMEWCMYPTFVVGAAMVLVAAVAAFSPSRATSLASIVLAARFVGNLTCSAIVLLLLSWAAQHHREDCERTLALFGMLAFFVEWVFILSGAHEKFFWWTTRSRPSGLDVVEEEEDSTATPTASGRCQMYAFRPRSVYLNGLRPLAELYARFTIQSMLMWLYVSGVHKKARELLADAASGRDVVVTRVFVWWLLSAGVQLHMTEQMGSGFVDNLNVWARLLRGAREGKSLQHEETDYGPKVPEVRSLRLEEVVLRMCMDFVSNLMYYNLMYISVPVLLVASKQPIELVMNAFAVTYILTLDDEKDQRRIRLVYDKPSLMAACPTATTPGPAVPWPAADA